MDKTTQDLAWQSLPLKAKNEVKQAFAMPTENDYEQGYDNALVSLFGIHNLTSDAEGEEMLTVERKEVQKLYRDYCAERDNEEPGSNRSSLGGRIAMLQELFGSKCLPDELHEDNFANKESKPAEPKFKLGDKVKDISSPHDDGIYKVDDIKKSSDGFIYHIQGLIGQSNVKESDLEPYIEPKYHTGQKVCYNGYVYEVEGLVGKNRYALKGLNYDLYEDMIEPYTELEEEIRKSRTSPETGGSWHASMRGSGAATAVFSDSGDDRRLTIAAMAMQSILSNPVSAKSVMIPGNMDISVLTLAEKAVKIADTLIAECGKGGLQ